MSEGAYHELMGRIRDIELELHEAALALNEQESTRAKNCLKTAHGHLGVLVARIEHGVGR